MKRSLLFRNIAAVCITFGIALTENRVLAQDLIKVSEDTHIQSGGSAGNNYGGNATVIVKTNSSGVIDRMGLMKFDFTSLTDYNANDILSVRLYMGFHNSHTGTLSFYEYPDTWSEGTVTFNSAPMSDPASMTLVNTLTTSSAWHNDTSSFHGGVDLTNYFLSEMQSDQIMSIAIVGESSGTGYDLRSKENTTAISIPGQTDWGAYVEITYISETANTLFESFEGTDLPTDYTISAGTYTVENSLLDVDMALSGSNYRADIWYNQTGSNTAPSFTFTPLVDKYMAIKFIGERPEGNLKFEMQTVGNTWFNTEWNSGTPDGSYTSSYGNHIYYFDLSDEAQYTAPVDIDRIHFIIADNPISQEYQVDWIGTFSSLNAIDAYKDVDDIDGSTMAINTFSQQTPVIVSKNQGIAISNLNAPSEIKVWDMTGRLIRTVYSENAITFPSSPGLYLVSIESEGSVIRKKVWIK